MLRGKKYLELSVLCVLLLIVRRTQAAAAEVVGLWISAPANYTFVSCRFNVHIEAHLSRVSNLYLLETLLTEHDKTHLEFTINGSSYKVSNYQEPIFVDVELGGVYKLEASLCLEGACIRSFAIYVRARCDIPPTSGISSNIGPHVPSLKHLNIDSGMIFVLTLPVLAANDKVNLKFEYPTFIGPSYSICLVLKRHVSLPEILDKENANESKCHRIKSNSKFSIDVERYTGIVTGLFLDEETHRSVLRIDYAIYRNPTSMGLLFDKGKGRAKISSDEFPSFSTFSQLEILENTIIRILILLESDTGDVLSERRGNIYSQKSGGYGLISSLIALVQADESYSKRMSFEVIVISPYEDWTAVGHNSTMDLGTIIGATPIHAMACRRSFFEIPKACRLRIARHILSRKFDHILAVNPHSMGLNSRGDTLDFDPYLYEEADGKWPAILAPSLLQILQEISALISVGLIHARENSTNGSPRFIRPSLLIYIENIADLVLPYGFQIDGLILPSISVANMKDINQFRIPTFVAPPLLSSAMLSGAASNKRSYKPDSDSRVQALFVMSDRRDYQTALFFLQLVEESIATRSVSLEEKRIMLDICVLAPSDALPTLTSLASHLLLENKGSSSNPIHIRFRSLDNSGVSLELDRMVVEEEVGRADIFVALGGEMPGSYPFSLEALAIVNGAKVVSLLTPEAEETAATLCYLLSPRDNRESTSRRRSTSTPTHFFSVAKNDGLNESAFENFDCPVHISRGSEELDVLVEALYQATLSVINEKTSGYNYYTEEEPMLPLLREHALTCARSLVAFVIRSGTAELPKCGYDHPSFKAKYKSSIDSLNAEEEALLQEIDSWRGVDPRSNLNHFNKLWKSYSYADVKIPPEFAFEMYSTKLLRYVMMLPGSRGSDASLNYLVNSSSSASETAKASPESSHSPVSRVLCITYTYSARHEQIRAILDTWGKRCDGYVAASNESDPSISAVRFPRRGEEAFGNIWQKVRAMLLSIDVALTQEENVQASEKKHLEQCDTDDRSSCHAFSSTFDWIFVSGDDTFVFMDNLRQFISSPAVVAANAAGPVYAGQTWNWNQGLIYNHGGGGYLLNRAALSVFARNSRAGLCFSHAVTSMEDVMVASCLRAAGTIAMDTRDALLRPRFHHATPFARFVRPSGSIESFTIGLHSRWLAGENCCAQDTVSFHFIKEALSMRLMHYAAYYSL